MTEHGGLSATVGVGEALDGGQSRIFWDESLCEMTLVDPEVKRRAEQAKKEEIEREVYGLRCRVARQNLVYQLEMLAAWEPDRHFWAWMAGMGALLALKAVAHAR